MKFGAENFITLYNFWLKKHKRRQGYNLLTPLVKLAPAVGIEPTTN